METVMMEISTRMSTERDAEAVERKALSVEFPWLWVGGSVPW